MNITPEEVVALAREHCIKLERYDQNRLTTCLRHFLNRLAGVDYFIMTSDAKIKATLTKFDITPDQLDAMEDGFEAFQMKNKCIDHYIFGKRVATLAGLTGDKQ